MERAKKSLKSFGKKKSYVLPVGPDGMRSGKAQSSWREGARTQVGKQKCSAKDKKYFKLRSKVSAECQAEQVKGCRTKSLKK